MGPVSEQSACHAVSHGQPHEREQVDSSEQPAAVELTLELEHGRLLVGLDVASVLENDGLAVLAFKLEEKSFQFFYSMGDNVREMVASIGQRYPGRDELPSWLDKSIQVGPETVAEKGSAHPFIGKIVQLLDWQQFIELADALRDVETDASRDTMHRVLLNYMFDQYAQYFRMLRDEIRSLPEGGKLIAAMLTSHNEVLIDMGLRLVREPGLRAIVQDELSEVVDDHTNNLETRRRAFGLLEQAERLGRARLTRSEPG